MAVKPTTRIQELAGSHDQEPLQRFLNSPRLDPGLDASAVELQFSLVNIGVAPLSAIPSAAGSFQDVPSVPGIAIYAE